MHRLYPGITSSSLLGIESSSQRSEAITAPIQGEETQYELHHGQAKRISRFPATRGARVVGSFDHAVLPMPPVSCPFHFCDPINIFLLTLRGKPTFLLWTSCHAMQLLLTK